MNTKRITGNVSDVLPDSKIVINRGQKDGVEPGQTYQVYRMGEMLTDPKTGESLGALESICAYGTVEQVQSEEATLALEVNPTKIDTTCRVRRVMYTTPPHVYGNPSYRKPILWK